MPSGPLAGIGPVGDLVLLGAAEKGVYGSQTLLNPEVGPFAPLARPPASFCWPTWSPDGEVVLVSTAESSSSGQPPARLLRYHLASRSVQILYENPAGTSPMGPGLPHYVNPSPDGRHLLVLTQAPPSGLVLALVDAAARAPHRQVARGAPLFSAWSPASDAVLLHVGGELSLMELAAAATSEIFATNHVGYRVPAWSPDGKWFAVNAPDGRNHSLAIFDRGGRLTNSMAPAWNSSAFTWSPDGELIAQAQSRSAQPQRYTDLQLVSTSTRSVRPVRVAQCSAFVWSPTSEYLAVLTPDSTGHRLSWTVVDRDGGVVRRFPILQPSPELAVYAAFFDQYLLSHCLWSPEGTALVGFGRIPYDGVPPELLPACIYLFDVVSGEVCSISPGSVAFWPPRTGR